MKARLGMRFVHSRALDERNQPMVMRVTAVRKGWVFYRCEDGLGSWKVAEGSFSGSVGKVLDD